MNYKSNPTVETGGVGAEYPEVPPSSNIKE